MLSRCIWPYVTHSLQRDSCLPRALAKAKEMALLKPGERVVVVTGVQHGAAGSTNAMESIVCT